MTEMLFDGPEPIDWDLNIGQRAVVQLVWGDVPCVLRGRSLRSGYVEVELLLHAGGKHDHEGECSLVQVDPARIRL